MPLTTLQLHITHGLQLPSFTALRHTHIHHCTNYTAVTNHSSTLIVLPHLHLIHSPTYKQHTSLHTLQSLVLHRLTFWAFPLFSPGLPIYSDRLLPAFWPCLPLDILSVCHLPRPLHCPCCWFCLAFITPVTTFDHCLYDHLLSINKAAIGSNYTASSLQRMMGVVVHGWCVAVVWWEATRFVTITVKCFWRVIFLMFFFKEASSALIWSKILFNYVQQLLSIWIL